jgi:hypothetical protein
MIVTRQHVAQKLSDYLYNRMTLEELVDCAEQVMQDGDFVEDDYDLIRDIVGRIGLSDVRAFGLTWEDCQSYLSRLGYKAQVTVLEIA